MKPKFRLYSVYRQLSAFSLIATLLVSVTLHAQNLSLTSPSSPIGQRGLVYKGKPVFLVGSGSFWLLNDPYYYNPDGTSNLIRLQQHLDKYKPEDLSGAALGIIRVSAFGTPVRYSGVDSSAKRYPCARSSSPGARDGGNKFDCSQLDQKFFDHVLTTAREADQRGIVLGIILWDEIPLEAAAERWNHNPFCPENSIIDYGLPSCGGSAVPEFYSTSSLTLQNHQNQIVTKFVDTLINEPNVFFFIGNEYTGAEEWRTAQITDIDQANSVYPGKKIIHVSMDFGSGESSLSDGVSADTNKTGLGQDAYRTDNRPAVNQRDYRLVSGADVRRNNWDRFMDGAASAGTRDDYSGSTPPSTTYSTAALEDQQLRRFVNAIQSSLDRMIITDNVYSPGWSGRGAIGSEYIAYNQSSSGVVSVDLSDQTGTWQLFEWDTASNALPIARESLQGGQVVNWNLSFSESAVRIVKADEQGVKPASPTNLRAD